MWHINLNTSTQQQTALSTSGGADQYFRIPTHMQHETFFPR